MKAILLVHRYLAIGVGILMTLWCLSGFVMMYQSYPALDEQQRLNGLEALNFSQCCNMTALNLDNGAAAPAFRIEMLLGDPVFRPGGGRRGDVLPATNLRTGTPLTELSEAAVMQVARQYGIGNGIAEAPRSLGIIDIDQWTIQTARRNSPAYHISFDDRAATEIYISGTSGEVFQATTRKLRILGWLGAVPHWLYPTALRENGALWNQIVVWTSIAGVFLVATGMYVGLMRLRRNRLGKLASPFRGWWYWHHISGLIFGVLALTWVFSGLMTMNPWGALAGGATNDYRATIVGNPAWGEATNFLGNTGVLPSGIYKQIQPAPFNGSLYFMATTADGSQVRLNSRAEQERLTENHVVAAVAQLGIAVQKFEQLTSEDSYYYGHKDIASLPVYRVFMNDEEKTRLYINHETGSVRTLGASGRMSRWIRSGLHGLDFPVLRIRPIWDVVVILLLLGVTSLCMIGTWLAIKRVRMDWRMMRMKWRRRSVRTSSVHAN